MTNARNKMAYMLKQLLKILLITSVIFFAVTAVISTFFIYTTSYNNFIEWIRTILNKDVNWIAFIQSKIPVARYGIIRMSIVLFNVTGLIISSLILFHRKRIIEYTSQFLLKVGQVVRDDLMAWQTLNKGELTIFCLILVFSFVRSLWLAYDLPIQYDEAWIYNYFISNSFPESFMLPSNNHKLYTAIAWWFNLLPGNKTFIIRLPNIITGLITCILFFAFIKKYFGAIAALTALAWFSSCVPVAMYMSQGKSYMLVLLFHLSMFSIYIGILLKGNFNMDKALLLTISIAFGYIANPVFFFGHFFSTLFFIAAAILQRKYALIKSVFLLNVLVFPLVFPFYIVDLLSGSLYSLLQFAVTQKINADSSFLLCWNNNALLQTGLKNSGLIFLLIILAGIAISFYKKGQLKILLIYAYCSIIWLPFYAALVKDDTSMHKTIYITISVVIILIFIFRSFTFFLKRNYVFYALIAGLILTCNFFLLKNNSWYNWSIPLDYSVEKVSKTLLKANADKCYLSHYYYKPALAFFYKTQHKPLKIYMGVPGSVDYVPGIPVSSAPDYLIINNEQIPTTLIPPSYKKIFADQFITLYGR